MSFRGGIDDDALGQFQYRLFSNLQGALTAMLVHLGDRLGLYTALAGSEEPLTSAALAERTGLNERWVREWAFNQGAAELVVVDPESEHLSLTPEAAAVLASPDHEAFGLGEFDHLPSYLGSLSALEESFRTGIGHDFDSHGADAAVGLERSFEPWNSHHLVPDVLPTLDGITSSLDHGIAAADIGCGAGGAVLMMAGAFPNSQFTGYDISRFALDRAAVRLKLAGLTNAAFADPRDEPMPADGSLGFVTMFDCLHDMSHPQETANAVRASLADDGTWLLCDIKAFDTYGENVERNPMAALMYASACSRACRVACRSQAGPASARSACRRRRRGRSQPMPDSGGSAVWMSITPRTRSTKSGPERS